MSFRMFRNTALLFCLAFLLCAAGRVAAQPHSGPGSALSIPQSALMQPAELNQMLQSGAAHKLVIFQVGSHMLFGEAHIPGSVYAGPAAEDAGLQQLRARVEKLDRGTAIVIYCGCCPWGHCPNIAPAYHLLHQMGFTHAKALYLANNFGTDWVNKGYPVAQ